MTHSHFGRGMLASVAAALALFAVPAFAQQTDAIAACRAAHGEDLAARVACLEQALVALQTAAAEPDRPDWSIPGFRARQEEAREAEEAQTVRVRIVSVRYGRDGLGRFVTEEGQTWRETVAAPERRWLEEGQTYEGEISRNFMGSFRLNIDGIRYEYRVEPLD